MLLSLANLLVYREWSAVQEKTNCVVGEAGCFVQGTIPHAKAPVRLAYELTAEGQELAGALRLLADWGSRVARDAEPLRHAVCGTPVEARWYCPTCERPVEGVEAEQVQRV